MDKINMGKNQSNEWNQRATSMEKHCKQLRFPSLIYRVSALAVSFSKLFCGYKQTDFKVYMKRQITQNSPPNIEEWSWKTDANWLQDLL